MRCVNDALRLQDEFCRDMIPNVKERIYTQFLTQLDNPRGKYQSLIITIYLTRFPKAFVNRCNACEWSCGSM